MSSTTVSVVPEVSSKPTYVVLLPLIDLPEGNSPTVFDFAPVAVMIAGRTDCHFTVPARLDRKHDWRNHFDSDSYAYRVIGRWESLAKMNHGFVYDSTATTAERSAHYRKSDAPDRKTIQRLKTYCRAKGIISDECWGTNKWGHRVLGFWLVSHAEFCEEKNHQHRYWRPLNDAVRRARFHPHEVAPVSQQCRTDVAPESQPSRSEVAPMSHLHAKKVAPVAALEVAPSASQDSVKPEDTEKSLCVGFRQNGELVAGSLLNLLSLGSPLNPLSPLSVESAASGSHNPAPIIPSEHQPREPIGQEIEHLAKLCESLVGKTPDSSAVRNLLSQFALPEIETAFREYVSGLESREQRWAEKNFFTDGGARGVIHAIRQREKQISKDVPEDSIYYRVPRQPQATKLMFAV